MALRRSALVFACPLALALSTARPLQVLSGVDASYIMDLSSPRVSPTLLISGQGDTQISFQPIPVSSRQLPDLVVDGAPVTMHLDSIFSSDAYKTPVLTSSKPKGRSIGYLKVSTVNPPDGLDAAALAQTTTPL